MRPDTSWRLVVFLGKVWLYEEDRTSGFCTGVNVGVGSVWKPKLLYNFMTGYGTKLSCFLWYCFRNYDWWWKISNCWFFAKTKSLVMMLGFWTVTLATTVICDLKLMITDGVTGLKILVAVDINLQTAIKWSDCKLRSQRSSLAH